MKSIRWADVTLTVLATAWIAWSVSRFPAWTVDDAFIVARYASNAVAHGELAFNAGAGAADRVEGFTSPLAMLVAIAARALSLDPIGATKLVCIGAAIASPALVAWLARTMRASRLAGGLAALLFALYPEHAMHARSGLETELFVACSLGLFVAFARLLDARATSTPFVAMAVVTALARPEGIALAALLSATAVRFAPRVRRVALVKQFAFGIAVPIVVLAIARLVYYGSLVPNTFYAKRGSWNGAHAFDFGALINAGVLDVAATALVAWLLARIVRAPRLRLPPRMVLSAGCAAVAALVHLFAYARSEPIMDYGRRFAWHGAGFVAVLLIAMIDVTIRAAVRLARRRSVGLVVTGGLVIFAAASGFLRTRPAAERELRYASRQLASVGPLHGPTIAWIAENTPSDALVAVYPDAGRLPFVTGRRIVDFGKLNDRVLARAKSDAEIVRYFFDRRPDVIVFGRTGASREFFDSGAEAIVADPRFAAEYELAKRIAGDPAGDAYEIYRKVPR